MKTELFKKEYKSIRSLHKLYFTFAMVALLFIFYASLTGNRNGVSDFLYLLALVNIIWTISLSRITDKIASEVSKGE